MSKTVVIGDLHGKFDELEQTVTTGHLSTIPDLTVIIAGDVGVGFGLAEDEKFLQLVNSSSVRIRFIRGNHDNPSIIKTMPGFIPDGTIENGVLFVGGAWSIDHLYRTPMLNWWPDEELNDEEWSSILNDPRLPKVHTVVSHEGPAVAVGMGHLLPEGKQLYYNTTNMNLDRLFKRLPNVKRWVFGHYHESKEFTLNNTRFTMLPDSTLSVFVLS